ncbi:MAG TPA: universal stress protein [Actinomycetales bacterium]|nr:universal stress protein [Actinomycetales bacterium]
MPDVIAVVDDGHGTVVLAVASSVAHLVRGRLRRLVLPESAGRADAVLSALDEPESALAVLAMDRDPAAMGWHVMKRSAKPLVLVPGGVPDGVRPIGRVLVPLDGSREAAHAVDCTVELCTRAGVDLVVLHVFNDTTAPPFWDQSVHALHAWTEEFLSRHVMPPDARLEVRAGQPDHNVLDVATTLGADLIALGWSQHLEKGRARTVRRAVVDADVPVMLVPVPAPSEHQGPSVLAPAVEHRLS